MIRRSFAAKAVLAATPRTATARARMVLFFILMPSPSTVESTGDRTSVLPAVSARRGRMAKGNRRRAPFPLGRFGSLSIFAPRRVQKTPFKSSVQELSRIDEGARPKIFLENNYAPFLHLRQVTVIFKLSISEESQLRKHYLKKTEFLIPFCFTD